MWKFIPGSCEPTANLSKYSIFWICTKTMDEKITILDMWILETKLKHSFHTLSLF